MPLYDLLNNHSYYQILNKTIIRNKEFHFVVNLLDAIIILLRLIDAYHSNFISAENHSIKIMNLFSFFRNFSIIYKVIILTSYLAISFAIYISYNLLNSYKKFNKFDTIIINFFEFFLIRLLITFYLDALLSLNSLYFLLFLVLTIPLFFFIYRNMTFYHLTGFMIKIIIFPFDDFTSLCDRQKLFLKIIISVCYARKNYYLSKFMFIIQFIFYLLFLLYDTYIVFRKSYYLMNNEMLTKTKYSNLLAIFVIQLFMLILTPEEVLRKSFTIFIILIICFTVFLMLLFYNPYNYIIIDNPDNRENAFYYLFLVDRNKNATFFLQEKIKEHVYRCDYCKLCNKYHKLLENNIIEFNVEKNEIIDYEDLFNILYDGNHRNYLQSA